MRALDFDPRNVHILQQLSFAYQYMRRFPEMTSSLDRALTIVPQDAGTRVQRALVDLEWRADTKPLDSVITTILSEDQSAQRRIAATALYLALCKRDHAAAARALAVMPVDGCHIEGIPLPRTWCEAVAARVRGDVKSERGFLESAKAELEEIVRHQPNYPQALCALGLANAGLGRKEEAIQLGQRAAQLLPPSKDAINGPLIIEYLAVIYAWTGEKDAALDQLAIAATLPCDVSFGQLSLHPYWDSLRDDPRFKNILVSLAPK